MSSQTESCPCGSKVALTQCCLPIIENKRQAVTALELLKARYTAFTRGSIDFILESHHSKTRNEVKKDEIEDWSKNSEWLGLEVLHMEAGRENDQQGTILFSAQYRADGKTHDHKEKSLFEKENGQWKFLDAQGFHLGTFKRAEPKINRNDPCPCKSGKKYKKCCGA